jgi:hypothetical protein
MGLVVGLGLLLALALAAAGCGGGGGKSNGVASLGDGKATATTSPGGGKDSKQKALAYARCMRQHGIDMPDPKFDAAGHRQQQLPPGVGPDSPKFKAAQQACQQYLPSGGEPEKVDPKVQQQMLQFARCMRQHGIDIPDPKPGGGIDANGEAGVDLNSPKYKAADQACQQYQPKGQKQQQSSGSGS